MEQAIKQLVNTEGWRCVKELIIEEVKQDRINIEQTAEQIAIQYTAMVKAEESVKKALTRIDKMGIELQKKDTSYK